jgi:hypothetical protein
VAAVTVLKVRVVKLRLLAPAVQVQSEPVALQGSQTWVPPRTAAVLAAELLPVVRPDD